MIQHDDGFVRLPLLVTGVAGVAGYNAFAYFRRRYGEQVIGTRRVDNWPLSGEGIEPCDADDRDGLVRLCRKYRFASVLNCEGTCKLKSCELDPAMARRINVEGLSYLLEAIGPQTRLVHLSIDLVFSGQRAGGYTEEDPTDPVTVYGATMVESERLVALHRPDACILRISLPMGISFNGHAGAIDWIGSRFRKNKPATLYFDEVRTPAYTDCLNRLFRRVLASDLHGLYHAGGPRRLSLFQIAQIVNRVGGYDPDLLMGCLRHQAGPLPPRAGDVTLDSTKLAQALGDDFLDPWPHTERFVPDDPNWHRRRPHSRPGSPELLARVLYRNSARG